MFAAPMPIISWSALTSSPRRAAKLVAVAIVSVSDTRVIPAAATSSGQTSCRFVHGTEGAGMPCGSVPTVATPCCASPNAGRHRGGADDTAQHRGNLAGEPGEHEQHREHAGTDEEGRDDGLIDVPHERPEFVEEGVRVGGEAEQLRQLADDDRDRETVHVADLNLARQQVGHEAELAHAQPDLDQSGEHGEHPGQGDRPGGVVPLRPAAA